jgi:solute carrier family 25 phosphate transporter 3
MAQQERKLPFGKIEPNTAKYFYSCGLGGIIGMNSSVAQLTDIC